MKTIYMLFLGIFIAAINHLFNGWIWMMGYELGIVPLIDYLGYNIPVIPYFMFVLFCATRSLLKSKPVTNEVLTFDNPKFWTRYFGVIGTDLLALLILWIFNLIIL